MGWVLGGLYGAAVWMTFAAAKGQTGWRRHVLWVALLTLPIIPLYNMFASNPELLWPFAATAVFGASALAAGDAAIRRRAAHTAKRPVPMSAEAADTAYRQILSDQVFIVDLLSWSVVRRMLLVMFAVWLLTAMRFWVALFDPESVASGSLDAVFTGIRWVGVGVGILAFAGYVGACLLLRFRSFWRTLSLTEEEFHGAQERFLQRNGL